jgi:hypothetical protein
MDLTKVIKGRWFEAATPGCAWDCAFPPMHMHRSYIPSFVRRSVLFGKLRRVLLLLLPPPGKAEVRSSAILASCQAFRHSGGRPGDRAFFFGTRIEEAQERPLPASDGPGAAPPPKTTAPASWRLTSLPWVSSGAGGWWVTGATRRANCAC